MIRRIAMSAKPMIPKYLRDQAKVLSWQRFCQVDLDEPIKSIAGQIPYPVERQRHCMIVLGNGSLDDHTDALSDHINTVFCIPFHLPRGASISQDYNQVVMETGRCYSFNSQVDHGVQAPEACYTYSAFIVVSVLSPRGLKDARWREEMARKQQRY